MSVVVDASVALKWVLPEDGSEAARQLLQVETLAAPDLIVIECANVLWAKARRRAIDRQLAGAALSAILATPIELLPAANYIASAQTIAFELDQTVYDSLYLAAAMSEGAILMTADASFATAAARHRLYRSKVRLLGN